MKFGFYFQETSANVMMQTLEMRTLVEHPIASLWYLHVNPPLFDLVRLLLIVPDRLLGNDITELLSDRRLYLFHAILFGVVVALVYSTVRELNGTRLEAVAVSILWSIYPGNVAMATYLDPTYLSMFLFLLSVNRGVCWLVSKKNKDAYLGLTALLLLSWTRSLFQIQILIPTIVIASWIYLKSEKSLANAVKFGITLCLLFLPVKQFLLFGSFSTSTFVGVQELGMIQYNPTQDELDKVAIPSRLIINSQRVVSKYNSPENAVANYQQETVFRKRIIASPIDSLQAIPNTIATSARKALSATQDYQPNVASNRLPWSDISRWLFSGWRYVALGIIGLAGQLGRFGWRNKSLLFMLAAVAVVGSQILVGSVRFGTVDFNWTESNRLKFIVEPIVFCIIAVGLTSSVRLLRGTLRR
ncbi:MAG: hypothetical protein EBX92_07200 [Actinobacteria bacterium]|nr:hypothetical protein [Actinomycetota bacterium]